MKRQRRIDPDLVRELLDYRPETGDLVWRSRSDRHIRAKSHRDRWNKLYAGSVAGYAYQFKKGGNYYLTLTIKGVNYRGHVIAWTHYHGAMPDGWIDHIDGNSLNNRIDNLRVVTPTQNNLNMRRYRNNTSGVTGVRWEESRQSWRADITANKRRKRLGQYDDFFEAVCARKSAERELGFSQRHGR